MKKSLMSVPESTRACHVHILGKRHAWMLPIGVRTLYIQLVSMLSRAVRLKPEAALDNVELLLVRDGEMALYNAENMNCTGPTNILSFPALLQDFSAIGIDGSESVSSLILSVDAVNREAFLFHQAPQLHLLRLLAHGIGHIAGFDHCQEMDDFCNKLMPST